MNIIQNEQPYQLDPSQTVVAAEILATAFQNDPMYRYVIPNDEKRQRNLIWLMGRVIQYSLLYGRVYMTSANEGVICWLPPGRAKLTTAGIIRTGLFTIVLRFGVSAYRRFDDNMEYTNKIHNSHAPNPHWYLWAIGVNPTHQGKGVGGKLLTPILSLSSHDGTPCYLETHNEKNIQFYEKHGFKIVNEGKIPKHGLRVWAMLRDPQPPPCK
jgi:ribosomal protein S18 acetylase RimI-like enzyme